MRKRSTYRLLLSLLFAAGHIDVDTLDAQLEKICKRSPRQKRASRLASLVEEPHVTELQRQFLAVVNEPVNDAHPWAAPVAALQDERGEQ